MNQPYHETKCVIIVDAELPPGLLANTAAVLALTIGKRVEGIIGPDVLDGSGQVHTGITTMPLPILQSAREDLSELKKTLSTDSFQDLLVVDFSDAAQMTKNYAEYTQKIAACSSEDLHYLGIALYGNRKKINKLTGHLSLLR